MALIGGGKLPPVWRISMRKRIIIAVTSVALICAVMGYPVFPFAGWPWLQQRSRDVIIGRCTATPEAETVGTNGVALSLRGLIRSEIRLLCVLRGATNSGPTRVVSSYWPRQGEYYLIFANLHDGIYEAIEQYRIIPLGMDFPTNMLAGKSFDETIRALLQYRLGNLKAEMGRAQEEEKRLQEGLKQ
jgi:hypothetical protein